MLSIIVNFIRYLKKYQTFTNGGIYFSFLLTAIAGLAEGFGLILLLPIIQSFSDNNTNYALNSFQKIIFIILSNLNIDKSPWIILLLITFAFIIKAIFIFLTYTFNSYLQGRLIKELKKKMFKGFSNMSYQFYIKNESGDLTNIINEQINRSILGFSNLYMVGLRVINCIIYLFFACALAGSSGLIAILGSLFILFLFRWLNTATKNMSIKASKSNSKLANLTIESLQAFKYLKATNQFKIKTEEASSTINKLSGYQIKTSILQGFTSACREPVAVIIIMVILAIHIVLLNKPIDSLIVALILFYRGLISTLGVQGSWQKTQEYLGSFEIVLDKLKSLSKYKEINGLKKIITFNKIKLSNVFFKYESNKEYLFKKLNLEISKNKSIAFIGPSGSGKSTIANLICLILKPNRGKILIDNIDSCNIDIYKWRNQIGYVSQEMAIFNNTIAYNISLKNEDYYTKETLLKIKDAAKKANIHNFILNLPDGYYTKVGDQGIRLSGGQKQRLFIARELFRKPKILILDEATSSLDTLSEKSIKKSINALKGKVTIILIAHRLSTIKDCDYLYVIANGEILENGTYNDLYKNKDSFLNNLILSQKV